MLSYFKTSKRTVFSTNTLCDIHIHIKYHVLKSLNLTHAHIYEMSKTNTVHCYLVMLIYKHSFSQSTTLLQMTTNNKPLKSSFEIL